MARALVCVCACVCVYMYLHVCVSISLCVCTCMYCTCMHFVVCVSMCSSLFFFALCVSVSLCLCVSVSLCLYVCVCVRLSRVSQGCHSLSCTHPSLRPPPSLSLAGQQWVMQLWCVVYDSFMCDMNHLCATCLTHVCHDLDVQGLRFYRCIYVYMCKYSHDDAA